MPFPKAYRAPQWYDEKSCKADTRTLVSTGYVYTYPAKTFRPTQWWFSSNQKGNKVFPTNWTGIRVHSTPGQSYYTYTRRGKTYIVNSNCDVGNIGYSSFVLNGNSLDVSIPFSQNAYNRVLTQCLANIVDSSLNVGVAVAELAETANYLSNTSARLFKGLRAIKKGNIKGIKRAFNVKIDGKIPDNLSGRWLEYSYAVTPLLNDIYGATELFNEGLKKRYIISARSSVTQTLESRNTSTTYSVSAHGTSIYRARIRALLREEDVHALNLLGLQNPEEVAWELVPFSFVVDWGLPIGTWLQAMNAHLGLTFLDGHVSVAHKGVEFWRNVSLDRTTVRPAMLSGNSYGRDALSDFPTPSLYVKNPLSPSHGATTIALLHQLRR